MNFFQKKFLTLAAFVANIALTLVVAGVATYAWFTASSNVQINGDSTVANITASNDIQVDKEFLNFNDNSKAGVSSTNIADFTLGDYDKYIGQKNKYTNSIIRATLKGGWSASDDIYVDITCEDGHTPNSAPYNKDTHTHETDYTSNVVQFKLLTASYVLSDESQVRDATGMNVTSFDPNDLSASAAARYREVTTYFETKGLPGTRFVSLHNHRLYKPSNKITLLAPSIGLTGQQIATKVTLYLECSYNKDLAMFYNGPISLTKDITEIKFYTRPHKSGAYVKVGSSEDIATSNQYMITYDGFASDDLNPSFDGSASSFDADNNYRDVYVRGNHIPYTDITESQEFSYASSGDNFKLVSKSGKTIGLNSSPETSYTSGTGYIGDDASYLNTMTYDSGTGNTTIESNDVSSRFLRFNPNDTHFKYYDAGQHEVGVYKYKSDADQFLTLQSISLSSGSESSSYGNPWTYPGRVYANYGATEESETAETVDITGDPNLTITKANVYAAGPQIITFSYTDPYYGTIKTVTCTLTITNPTLALTIDTTNAKLYYIQNVDSLTTDGLVVTANKSDGSKVVLTDDQYSYSELNNSVVGTQTITVSYTDETNTTVTANYTVTVVAQSNVSGTYTKISSLSDLLEGDRVLITTYYNDSTYYYLPSTTTSSAPTASSFTESSTDTITGSYDNYLFTVGKDNDNWTFINADGKYLHNNNDTDGVRINNTYVAPWEITATSSGYKMKNNEHWLGVYNDQDWRSYTLSDHSNYKGSGELINFYKRVASSSNVTSIYIADTKKTSYYTGDGFVEPVVYAVYSDNSYQLLTPSDYTKTPANPLADNFAGPAKTQTVTISFGGQTASYDITVTRRIPTSISVSGYTSSFVQGGTFEFGGTATITYNNGDTETQTPVLTGYDLSTSGNQTVTASYTYDGVTVTTTYSITVTPRTPVSIALSGTYPTTFVVGDTFSYDGLVVTATFNSGPDGAVTPTSVSTPDMSSSGTKPVTVTYTANDTTVTATYDITIEDADLYISGTGVSNNALTIVAGQSLELTANTNKQVTVSWTTADDTKVSLSESTGSAITITAVAATAPSTVRITASATINGTPVDDYVDVTVNAPNITLSPDSSQNLYQGSDSLSVTATSVPAYSITWSTSSNIISLSSNSSSSGSAITVTANSNNPVAVDTNVTLTATTAYGGSASITITVKAPVAPASLQITDESGNDFTSGGISLNDGELQLLCATGTAHADLSKLKWTSSNSSKITVNSSGLVELTNSATGGDTATITVYDDRNNNNTKDSGEAFDTCSVTVVSTFTRTITLDPTKSACQSFPYYGITLSVTDGTLTNGTDYRVYKNQTLTISSAIGSITNIALTYSSTSYDGGGWSASYSPNSTSWTSSTASGEQARITLLVITVETETYVSSIGINHAPTKTSYAVGDDFDPTGLILEVTYGDGFVENVTYTTGSGGNSADFNFTPSTNLQTSNTSVTITYGGKTCNQTISVSSETPTTYTVTFESNGGSSVSQITNVTYDSTISAPTAPTKTNYVFDGWYKESTLTTPWDFSNDTVTSDIILYAKWSAQQSEQDTNVEYQFTAKNWTSENGDWLGSGEGNQLTANQGVQITTGKSDRTVCSPSGFYKITKIEIKYCTNASSGVGTISAYYCSTSSTSTTGSTQIGSTFNVTKPSSGGTTLKTATFTPSSTISGTNCVQFNVTCSTNSVYIYSITVYYKTSS